jgi:ElaA protein
MELILKHFNELSLEELYDILRLRNEVFILEQNCFYLDCDGKDKNAHHLFLKEDDKIVAYLRILNKGVSYPENSIGRVIVTKSFRGQNISNLIIEKAIKFIETELKGTEIRISAQAHLQKLYGKLGFKTVSEEYLEDDIPHVQMLYKKITP